MLLPGVLRHEALWASSLALVVCLASSAPIVAADDYVTTLQALVSQQTRRDFFTESAARFGREKVAVEHGASLTGTATVSHSGLAEATRIAAARAADLGTALEQATERTVAQASKLETEWRQAREHNLQRRLGKSDDAAPAAGNRPRWGMADDWILAVGAGVAILVWGAVVVHARRRWCRMHIRGGAATAICAVVLMAVGSVIGSAALLGRIPGAGSERSSVVQAEAADLAKLEQQLVQARSEAVASEQAAGMARRQWLSRVATNSSAEPDVTSAWLAMREKVCAYCVAAARVKSAQSGLAVEQRAETDGRQQASVAVNVFQRREFSVTTLAAVGGLWFVVAAIGWVQRRQRTVTCPKCHAAGSLKPVPLGDGPRSRALRDVQCSSKWDGRNACNFRMRDDHRAAMRLCFPTVGIPASGKTHWMAVAYDRLLTEKYEQRLDFHHLETRGSLELDRVLGLLHAGQRELQANQVCLPDPVVFRFSDRSRLARSEVLLNLFDYSGEVFRMLDLDRPLRRRMMQADGIVLFLDPLRGAEGQLHEMKRFLDDADRSWLHMPGAVCISKIDMLQASDAAPEIGEFQQRLGEILGNGLAAIDARSRVTEPLVRALWPDVDMDRIVRKTFRGHFHYFPVTSVGFADSAAVAAPQFVLEPLLWLLEQNGFDVFDRGKPLREVQP